MDSLGTSATHPYTCLSCSLAFTDATFQRDHYATDLHRYNSKRRVAGLTPVSIELFEEKIMDRKEPEVEESGRLSCKACNKNFNSVSTQTTHNLSRKHKETVLRVASNVKADELNSPSPTSSTDAIEITNEPSVIIGKDENMEGDLDAAMIATTSTSTEMEEPSLESSGDPKLDRLIAKRIIASPPIPSTTCLFCPHSSSSPVESTAHMRASHSFIIPEEEYLVDLEGLLRRLGEEVGTWNLCVCCGKGYGGNINLDTEGVSVEELKKKASKGVEAVRKHMKDKSHCKLRYETETQRLDLADFYDFRPSYPDYVAKKQRKALLKNGDGTTATAEGWEDSEDMVEGENEEGMEVVYEDVSSEEEDDSDDELPASEITYGDTPYELVLPSGARIGHRAHTRIYKQNLAPYLNNNPFPATEHSSPAIGYKPSPHSKALLSLVPRMASDKSHARPLHDSGLIRTKNGNVIQARNKGEAKEAGKDMRKFRELKSYNDFALIRGMIGNSQKHYRDHLLQ